MKVEYAWNEPESVAEPNSASGPSQPQTRIILGLNTLLTPAATMSGPGYRVPPNYPETPMSSNMSHSDHPLNNDNYYSHVRSTSATSSIDYHSAPPPPPPRLRGDATHQGVQTGQIGGGFGPYAIPQNTVPANGNGNGRFSSGNSSGSSNTHEKPLPTGPQKQTNTIGSPAYLWDTRDPDLDDALHNPDPKQSAIQDAEWTLWSIRGWANYIALFVILGGLITLFAGYPIIAYYQRKTLEGNGFNLGGINVTGQVPFLPNLATRIDKDTPQESYTRTGFDGNNYNLVFSDEFNTDGRSFYPGDDAFWEAVDLQYWPTADIEWYDPGQVTTQGGSLVITMVEQPNHGMNFMSGMIQSWNKFCFTGGYIEAAVSLPGSPDAPGFWPGVWTMGNLGRAGYGATTEGLWPYSYDTCDLGTFPNQTDHNGNPASSATGNYNHDGPISYLPGQRLSSCTCPGGDHPGPNVNFGRSAPEIDIIEAQINLPTGRGQASQSFQLAPFDDGYNYNNVTPATTIYDTTNTVPNTYKGGVWQQALSSLTFLDATDYVGTQGEFGVYGFEYNPSRGSDGYITWAANGQKTWTVTTASMGPNPISKVGQRLVPEEPMYMIVNFGMSPGFQGQDFSKLQFPAQMKIDYIRIYQKEGNENWNCSPSSHPTEDYINNHINAYTNPNFTTWSQAGYTFPRNSLWDGC